jgi:hypothetical protein
MRYFCFFPLSATQPFILWRCCHHFHSCIRIAGVTDFPAKYESSSCHLTTQVIHMRFNLYSLFVVVPQAIVRNMCKVDIDAVLNDASKPPVTPLISMSWGHVFLKMSLPCSFQCYGPYYPLNHVKPILESVLSHETCDANPFGMYHKIPLVLYLTVCVNLLLRSVCVKVI